MNGRKVVHMENTNIFFDKSGIFDNFLALIASTFDAHSVLLFMPESENSAAKLVSFFSMSDKSVNQNAQLAQGKGLVGWILKNKQPLLYQIPEENQANLGYYLDDTEDSIHSFMGTFIAGNGALCLDSKKRIFFRNQQNCWICTERFYLSFLRLLTTACKSIRLKIIFSCWNSLPI